MGKALCGYQRSSAWYLLQLVCARNNRFCTSYACTLTHPTSEPCIKAVTQPGVPQKSPFPVEENIFVIFRGKVPGIHYGWLVPFYLFIIY